MSWRGSVWNPTPLSKKFNKIPHMDSSLNNVPAVYNPDDEEYQGAIKRIAFLPIVISILIVIAMIGLVIHKLYVNKVKPPKYPKPVCRCGLQSTMRTAMTVLIIILFLLILLEFLLHSAVLNALPGFLLHPENANMKAERKKYVDKSIQIIDKIKLEKEALDKGAKTDPIPISDLNDTIYNWYDRIKEECCKLNHTILTNRLIHTPKKQIAVRFEWVRFIICLFIWILAIVFCVTRFYGVSKSNNQFTMCGIIVAGCMCGYLLAACVTIGDACQDPDKIFTVMKLNERYNSLLQDQYKMMCYTYNQSMHGLVMNCRRHFIMAQRFGLISYFKFHASNVSINFRTSVAWKDNSFQNIRYRYMETFYLAVKKKYPECNKTANEFCMTDYMLCNEKILRAYKEFTMNGRRLCEGDAVLKWLVIQLVLVVFIALIFIALTTLNTINITKDLTVFATAVEYWQKIKAIRQKTCKHPECTNINCMCLKNMRRAALEKQFGLKRTETVDTTSDLPSICVPLTNIKDDQLQYFGQGSWTKCHLEKDALCSNKSKCSVHRRKTPEEPKPRVVEEVEKPDRC